MIKMKNKIVETYKKIDEWAGFRWVKVKLLVFGTVIAACSTAYLTNQCAEFAEKKFNQHFHPPAITSFEHFDEAGNRITGTAYDLPNWRIRLEDAGSDCRLDSPGDNAFYHGQTAVRNGKALPPLEDASYYKQREKYKKLVDENTLAKYQKVLDDFCQP